MLSRKNLELSVGLFVLVGMMSIFILAFKVSGLGFTFKNGYYSVRASFENIGDLKLRAPVTMSGVRIGEVAHIWIDSTTLKANVDLRIDKKYNKLPSDTSAKILTAGIIGANYIELVPGYLEEDLKNGDKITDTQSAIVLENLIGQLMYKFGSGDKK